VDGRGKFISSVGRIGGSKWAPRDMGNGIAIQEDNVAVEYNIAPATSAEEFVKSIQLGLEVLTEIVKHQGLVLSLVPSASFDADQLESDQAKHFGCEPDLNAWSGKLNKKPKAKDKNLRSAGGHVHVQTNADPLLVGRWMDILMGSPFVLVDKDQRRRLLYGKAGAIRVKPYPGIEYRVLSNHWLTSDNLIQWVYGQAHKAVQMAEKGATISSALGKAVRKAINTGDITVARQIAAETDSNLDLLLAKG
jgi:hypothetical protein